MAENNDRTEFITRREAILRVSAMLGGVALVGQGVMLSGCAAQTRPTVGFTADEIAFLDEVADTILPETSTPGAKAAGVGPFMAMMVADTYDAREQRVFRTGMRTLDEECREIHGSSFIVATPTQRLALLERLDVEQLEYMEKLQRGAVPDDASAHYFRMMKELTLLGYFTSEIGYNQAMRYVETPGRYEACVPYTPGEPTWAPHA